LLSPIPRSAFWRARRRAAPLGQLGRVCIATLCVRLRFLVPIRKNVLSASAGAVTCRLGCEGNTACIPGPRLSALLPIAIRSRPGAPEQGACFLPRRRTEKPRNERAAAASRFVKSARRGSCWRLSRKRFLSLLADLESLPLCTRESNDRRPLGGVIRAFVHQGAALATALLSLAASSRERACWVWAVVRVVV
jgi:hypothetical protein